MTIGGIKTNKKISETVFSGKTVTFSMADVQHMEATDNGYFVITKHTKYNFEHDMWENPIFLNEEEGQRFLKAWCIYRHEVDY